ncbi:MAG: Holliday junction resolvase RuvX [Alphaproteobacteria bacterium]|nr:Holliday junction resolvase RuvX [Alphaproteobacteria bacterium]
MNINDFNKCLPPYKALLGFDYGAKRIGLAVSDLMRGIATSYKILYRSAWEKDLAEIKKTVIEKEIGGFVFGLPLQMNGEEGEIAKEVRAFADKLTKEIPLPVLFWDERLSSSAVERFLIDEIDLSRAKRKKVLDSSAAAYILQGALDALQYQKSD